MNPVYGPSKSQPDAGDVKQVAETKKFNIFDVLGLATSAVAVFQTLDKTDLKIIAANVLEVLKNPVAAAVVVGLYVYFGSGKSDRD